MNILPVALARTTRIAALAALSGSGLFLASGCVVAVRPAPVAAVYAEPQEVVVSEMPPSPLVEVVPVAPGPGYFWVAGYYHWNGGRWIWIQGRYLRPPHAGARWVAARYEMRGNVRVYVAGHWR